MKTVCLGLAVAGLVGLAGPLQAQPRYVGTLAGSAAPLSRSIDATGTAAQFFAPRGVAVDAAGNLYVADSGNHSLRKITPAGVVSTVAGQAGVQGYADGDGSAARFAEPFGVAVDGAGNLYVADTSNNAVRKVTPAGVVSTLAGGRGKGSADGTGPAAQFDEPRGIAVDSAGTVYLADYNNSSVRKISAAGVVSTLAGLAGVQGSSDGSGSSARFNAPSGIAVDGAGNVFVADTANRTLRKITPQGVVSTLAGSPVGAGSVDGTGAAARFSEPRGVSIDAQGSLYVADYHDHTLRKVTAAGVVTTVAGSAGQADSGDGSAAAARFFSPSGTAVDAQGQVYVADTANNTIRKLTPAGQVSTWAGLAGRSSSVDATGAAARFEDPYALAVDAGGQVWVVDATDHSIRRVSPAGVVSTVAGQAGSHGSTDGAASAARFFAPTGIAVDSAGNAYVADSGNATVRKISAAGVVSTLAGKAGLRGRDDGLGSAARFGQPFGVAVDGEGNVYVADTANHNIRKISPAGLVTTLAGSGTPGLVDGVGKAAQFAVPFDLAVDAQGNVYVCDHGNHAIRRITPAGVVSTLAGGGGGGFADGPGGTARLRFPSGVAVDAAGTVYVADTDNQVLRQISPAGLVSTAAGGRALGSANGVGTAARFFNPKDVAVDAAGTLYVADRGNHTLRKASLLSTTVSADCLFDWAEAQYASLFAPPAVSQASGPYHYRYYTATQSYLGVSSLDQHLYYLPPSGLQDGGPQADWFSRAGCQ